MTEDSELGTLHEVGDDLWREVPLTEGARAALVRLEKRAYAQFAEVLAPLGMDDAQAATILRKSFSKNDPREADVLSATLAERAMERGWQSAQFVNVMRIFNIYMGNHVARNIHGEPYSPVLARAYTEVSAQHRKRFHEFPERKDAIHTAIDAYMDECVEEYVQDRTRIEAVYPDSRAVQILADRIEQQEDLRGIAHFATDWYADEVPDDILKKTPEQSAVLLLLAVEEINVYGPTNLAPLLNKQTLRAQGGWKSVPQQSVIRLAEILTDALPTLEPFLITRGVSKRDTSFTEDSITESDLSTMQMVGSLPEELDPHEFEMRLAILFERYGMPAEECVEKVRTMVYEMDKAGAGTMGVLQAYHEAFQALFPATVATNEQAHMELYATAVDAWNVFPHKALNGKSPLDMIRSADGV